MNSSSRGLWLALAGVLAWRFSLLVFTAQPVPANDAFPFDGAVIHWLQHRQYFNPSLAESFPISGRQVFAMYPPLYQAALLPWMAVFGTSVIAAMWFHFVLFGAAAVLVAVVLRQVFPSHSPYGLAILFLVAVTFDDRPEGLAHILGLSALWLIARQLKANRVGWPGEIGLSLALLAALYTSPIAGGFYFGTGFLTRVAAWWLGRRALAGQAFVLTAALFAGIAFYVSKAHPLWWNGFLENSRQTPVLLRGWHLPSVAELLKLVRTAPVFVLGLACLPWLVSRRNALVPLAPEDVSWLSLVAGVAAAGGGLLFLSLVLVSANYVAYVLFVQVFLAAGLLGLAPRLGPASRARLVRPMLAACLVLASVRAVGLSTWGVACTCDVGHGRAQEILRAELQPLVSSNARVVASSAYLYFAAQVGLRNALHSDWIFDRRYETPTASFEALARLRSPKLVLTQFDFYRNYVDTVDQLRRHPEVVAVTVRNTARVRAPDSYPALQRVVQHVSWAPVIVDLEWK